MLSGVNPFCYLDEPSEFRRLMYETIVDRVVEIREKERKDLAARVANGVGKALGGKK